MTTRADGSFAFTHIPAGAYRLSVSAAGFDPVRNTAVSTDGNVPQSLTVSLSAATLGSLRTIASSVTSSTGATTINRTGEAQSTVTSQDFIDRGDAQVQNILEEEPGVELTRASSGGAPGANTDVSVRGASTYETQTLLDGHPIVGGRFSTFLIQFLNPLVLGSVEVDKGPGVFGNTIQNAVGGTVNFRTPDISTHLVGKATAGYDSYNGSTYSARVSDTIGKFGFLAAYGFNGTPGYYTGSILSVNSASQSLQGQTPPNAVINEAIPASESFQNRAQVFKLAYDFSPVTSLQIGEINEQSYVDYTATLATVEPFNIVPCLPNPASCNGSTSFNNPNYNGYVGHTVLASSYPDDGLYLGNTELDNEPIFTADFKTRFGPGAFLGRYYVGSIDRNIDDPQEANQEIGCSTPGCYYPTLDTPFYQRELDHLHGADFEYSAPFGRNGNDLVQASYDQHSDESQYCSGSTFVFTASDCSINNLLLTSRTFSIRAEADIAPKLRVGFANYFSDTTFVGSRYDPRATLVWTPQRNSSFRFAVGTAYVAPPVDFVAPTPGDTKAVVNNTLYVADALKPETSAGIDLGADFGIHKDSKFTIDLYRTALTNRFSTTTVLPAVTPAAGSAFGYYNNMPFDKILETYNASDANEEGLEFGFVKQPRVGFGGLVNVDLSRAYNYNTVVPSLTGFNIGAAQTGTIGGDGTETPGYQIPGFPYSHGRGELTYTFPTTARLDFGWTVYGANNSFGEPGFSLFDLDAQAPLYDGVRLQGSIINLFDHDDYRTLGEYGYGYKPPGETTPYSLFFAPPRRLNLQLVYPFGGR